MPRVLKRERLAAQQERQKRATELACAQKAQAEDELARLQKEWRMLLKQRLDSPESYTHFEAFQIEHADNFYYSRVKNAALSLLLIHQRDGKPVDPATVLNVIEQEPYLRALFLHIAKQLAFQEKWTDAQRQRLQELVLEHVHLGKWDKSSKPFIRLARAITDDAFEARVSALQSHQGTTGELATWVADHLEQERLMQRRGRWRWRKV